MFPSYISACSVKSHLVKDAGEVSDLVLKIALLVKVSLVKHQRKMLNLEVNPVVEELCRLFLRSCSFSQSVIPAIKIMF